jgi:hypothetical protein
MFAGRVSFVHTEIKSLSDAMEDFLETTTVEFIRLIEVLATHIPLRKKLIERRQMMQPVWEKCLKAKDDYERKF